MRREQDEFLERLFREHFNELEMYAHALLRNRDNAQAAVQEAFYVACRKIDELMKSPAPVAWMKVAVKNIAHNMMRRRSRELRLVVPLAELLAEPAAPAPEDRAFLELCRRLLSPEELDLVVRIVVDGIPPIEKAKELRISIWACYKRLDRALEKLRKGLEHEL